MSRWNHSICEDCWKEKNPEKEPTRATTRKTKRCCICGKKHMSRIFVREDPEVTDCTHT